MNYRHISSSLSWTTDPAAPSKDLTNIVVGFVVLKTADASLHKANIYRPYHVHAHEDILFGYETCTKIFTWDPELSLAVVA